MRLLEIRTEESCMIVNENRTNSSKPLQWHPAFFADIQIELEAEITKKLHMFPRSRVTTCSFSFVYKYVSYAPCLNFRPVIHWNPLHPAEPYKYPSWKHHDP